MPLLVERVPLVQLVVQVGQEGALLEVLSDLVGIWETVKGFIRG